MPIQAIKETADLIGTGESLSPSLRLTKFAKISIGGKKNQGDVSKRHAIDFFCNAKPYLRGDNSSSLFDSVPGAKSFIMKLQSRMIINQAGGVLENAGLCIHRHFGYPYIPGSAIKGIARHAAWLDWINTNDETEKSNIALKIAITFGFPTGEKSPGKPENRIKEQNEYLDDYLLNNFRDLFGENGNFSTFSGSVAFIPAVPYGKAKLETDVLTCHHMNYYNEKQNKALDNESPNPQFFPVVAAGTSFSFTIIPLRNINFDFDTIEFAFKYLQQGLKELGIGAKTAAGYGWFEEDDNANKQILKRKQKQEEIKQEQERQAALSPEERATEEYLKSLGSGDVAGIIKGQMAKIADLNEMEQRSICLLLKNKYSHIWQTDLKEAIKAEGQNEKKKSKNKGLKRVNAVKPIAEKLGIDLS